MMLDYRWMLPTDLALVPMMALWVLEPWQRPPLVAAFLLPIDSACVVWHCCPEAAVSG
jgi:hypothetical protein